MDTASKKQLADSHKVLCLTDIPRQPVSNILQCYGLSLTVPVSDSVIPGSFWGDTEAGLIADKLYARADTPIHSVFHEACHYVCMTPQRRSELDTNAGGDYDEENAVCYLQILLAGLISQIGQARMMQDMDAWGYSFRLGSARRWFEEDAEDACHWLQQHGIIGADKQLTGKLRMA